jgi:hypothetical protein
MSAHGQNPYRRPSHTDFTNGWFGWSWSKSSNTSTFTGVTIWNRSGLSEMVCRVIGCMSCSGDGLGRGLACSVHSAVVSVCSLSGSQTLYLWYFGLIPYTSIPGGIAGGFPVLRTSAPFAFVLVSTTRGRAPFVVEPVAHLGLFPCLRLVRAGVFDPVG